MNSMNKHLAEKIGQSHEQQLTKQETVRPCRIFSINIRTKQLVLQDPVSGDLLQIPSRLPHQDVGRIPTPDRNSVMLLTMGGYYLSGVPILYDRSYIAPKIFETIDPASEQA
jgi:hypothetical protein